MRATLWTPNQGRDPLTGDACPANRRPRLVPAKRQLAFKP